ncbi:MAG: gamma-glutamylcyclotransferase [Alphaproteobacteria bacterium]|jgi:cation transport protein ChaC|nr:gamma-glutamylcyclotransferase [Alphaproteobacteria bacterium]
MKKSQPDLSHLKEQYCLSQNGLSKTLEAVMLTHDEPSDLWVFAYGSLMWRPAFNFIETHTGLVHGFHRSFCVYSHFHRGTRNQPGLVLGLDKGGSCKGVLYKVSAKNAKSVVNCLIKREMVTSVYHPRWVSVHFNDKVVRAHTYTPAHKHIQYAGKLKANIAARYIRNSKGVSGTNIEYLINTITYLQKLNINASKFVDLLELVKI